MVVEVAFATVTMTWLDVHAPPVAVIVWDPAVSDEIVRLGGLPAPAPINALPSANPI